MKCAHPQCSHGIGLVSYRRAAFARARYCSKKCRDSYVIERGEPAIPQRAATTYFEWLLLQPGRSALARMVPAVVRPRSR
jgi:hypothetical protein